VASPFPPDTDFADLWARLRALVDVAGRWARRLPVDLAAAERCRHEAIVQVLRRQAETVAVYRALAAGTPAQTVEEIAAGFMLAGEVFKSYDPRWLAEANYEALTGWLAGLFHRPPEIDAEGVDGVDAWRRRLRDDRIFLSWSSGTSGRLSFVPRDPVAQHALRTNGAASFHRRLPPGASGIGDLACLVLGPRGSGMGFQGAATGLARSAARAHFLYDHELGASRPGPGRPRPAADLDRAYAAAVAFLRAAAADRVPALLFGPPFEVARACAWVVAAEGRVVLPSGSLVVTGGGWKAEMPVAPEALQDAIGRAFGVGPEGVIDVYSTAESNAVLLTCREGRYHVPPLVEAVVLDDLLLPVGGDEAAGMLGLLDPFAVSYPGFLMTGDVVRLTHRPCRCGLGGPSVLGRIERAPAAEPKGCAGALAVALR